MTTARTRKTAEPKPAAQPDDAITADDGVAEDADPTWAKLAAPFDAKWIEKLPKVLNRQDQRKGRCAEDSDEGRYVSADGHFCGGWHSRAVHLDYVGHAGITMRLNAVVGPAGWKLEPVARDERGLPVLGDRGPFWCRLTITTPDGEEASHEDVADNYGGRQEAWGDALRRCAMRFGVGTYLWAKSEHAAELAQHKDPDPLEQKQAAEHVLATALKHAPTLTPEQFDAAPVDPALLDVEVDTATGRVKLRVALEQVRSGIVIRAQQPAQEPARTETPAPAPEAAQEPASAPQEAQDPAAEAPAQQPAGETPQEAAYDLAREAIASRDAELIRTLYRGLDEELAAIDVLPVLGDDDLHTLGVPAGTERVVLGALLMAAGRYVTEQGIAVRDPEPERAFTGPAPTSDADDPWADGSASGRPRQ
jgi:hypothetical protein